MNDEQLTKCQECTRKLKYFGPDGYICPDCEFKEENKDEEPQKRTEAIREMPD